jgi:hypothetical protein
MQQAAEDRHCVLLAEAYATRIGLSHACETTACHLAYSEKLAMVAVKNTWNRYTSFTRSLASNCRW